MKEENLNFYPSVNRCQNQDGTDVQIMTSLKVALIKKLQQAV